MLEIRNLHARIADTDIIGDLDLPFFEVIQECAVEAQKLIGISLEGSVG